MSIEWILYWIEIFSKAHLFFAAISIIAFVVASLLNESCKDLEAKDQTIASIFLFSSFLFLLVFVLSATLIPSKQTMYTMAFVRYSKQSDIPEKVLKAIEVKLDEIILGE